jgi:hypothetical protein
VVHRVAPDTAGKAVLFFHDHLHDGEPIAMDCPVRKWLCHNDILYERRPNNDDAPVALTASQQEAQKHLELAQQCEANGQIEEATQSYRRAYRLDPSLDV